MKLTLYTLVSSLIIIAFAANSAQASIKSTQPDYSYTPSSLTISPGVSDQSKSQQLELTLENKTFIPVRDLRANFDQAGFQGTVKVTKGDHCSPIPSAEEDKKCTLTVTATVPSGARQTQDITLRLTSNAPTKTVPVTVEQSTVHAYNTYITDGDGNQTITLKNTSDVPLLINSAHLDPSSNHGLICDDSNDNCIDTSNAGDDGNCLSGSDNANTTAPGDTCKLQVKVDKNNAWGSVQLDLEGNMKDGEKKLPVNIAPANLVFLKPNSDSSNSCSFSSGKEQPADYLKVPKNANESSIVCIKNYSNFPAHARIKLRSGSGTPSNFNFEVKGDDCSNTFIPGGKACKVKIYNNGASSGDMGEVDVAGNNVQQARLFLAFAVKGDIAVVPINPQYLSQKFAVNQWPGLTYQQFKVINTSDNKVWVVDSEPSVSSGTPVLSVVNSDTAGHLANTCKSTGSSGIPPGSSCQFWVRTGSNLTNPPGIDSTQPEVGFLDDSILQNIKLTLETKSSGNKVEFILPPKILTYLYVGGDFDSVDGVANTAYLARFGPKPDDYSKLGWSSVVPIAQGGSINSFASAQNGNLLFGGNMTKIGTPPSPNSAPSPSQLSQGLTATNCGDNTSFQQLTDKSGATLACNIARFDGAQWHALWQHGANGVNGTVDSISINFNDKVYVGGEFDQAGLQSDVGNIAMWQQRQGLPNWRVLGVNGNYSLAGVNGPVKAMSTHTVTTSLSNWPDWVGASTDKVLVGGDFDKAGNSSVDSSNALWEPENQNWLSNASDLTGFDNNDPVISSLTRFDGTNYAGGEFDIEGTTNSHPFAEQSGSSWQKLSNSGVEKTSGFDHPFVNSLMGLKMKLDGDSSRHNYLFVSGAFQKTISNKKVKHIMAYNLDNSSSRALSTDGVGANDTVNTVFSQLMFESKAGAKIGSSHGFVFIGGPFTQVNNKQIKGVGYWTAKDQKWHALTDLSTTKSVDRSENNAKSKQPHADQVSGFQNGQAKALIVKSMMRFNPAERS